MYKILHYGKPYTNYTTYKPIDNPEYIETIYVDNQSCTTPEYPPEQNTDIPYYVEIHYNKSSGKKKLETILKHHEIETLIAKYGSNL